MADEEAGLSAPRGSAAPGPGAGARRVWDIFSAAESLELLASVGVKLGRLVYNGQHPLSTVLKAVSAGQVPNVAAFLA